MITGKRLPNLHGKLEDLSTFRDQDWYSPGKCEPYYREYPPRKRTLSYDQYKTDINGNRYSHGSRDNYNQIRGSSSRTNDFLAYGYNDQYSYGAKNYSYGYHSSSFPNMTDKNYNQNSRLSNLYNEDPTTDLDLRRISDFTRSPSSRYRNHNNNRNDRGARDLSWDGRRRRDQDRYQYGGERELPLTPVLGRRHSWDTHEDSHFGRGNSGKK